VLLLLKIRLQLHFCLLFGKSDFSQARRNAKGYTNTIAILDVFVSVCARTHQKKKQKQQSRRCHIHIYKYAHTNTLQIFLFCASSVFFAAATRRVVVV